MSGVQEFSSKQCRQGVTRCLQSEFRFSKERHGGDGLYAMNSQRASRIGAPWSHVWIGFPERALKMMMSGVQETDLWSPHRRRGCLYVPPRGTVIISLTRPPVPPAVCRPPEHGAMPPPALLVTWPVRRTLQAATVRHKDARRTQRFEGPTAAQTMADPDVSPTHPRHYNHRLNRLGFLRAAIAVPCNPSTAASWRVLRKRGCGGGWASLGANGSIGETIEVAAAAAVGIGIGVTAKGAQDHIPPPFSRRSHYRSRRSNSYSVPQSLTPSHSSRSRSLAMISKTFRSILYS